MNNLPEETRRKFTSDMGFIADYLNEGSFQSRSGQQIRHPTALCRMMEALTQDTRFTGQIKELPEKLYSLNRDEEARRAVLDLGIRAKLYEGFQIASPISAS